MAAPAPYHDMYGPDDVIPRVRSTVEQDKMHPVHRANQDARSSTIYDRDGARDRVIVSYMGLITQIDDHIGRLMAFMETSGRLDDTMIIFTSDHGDYLGDHGMGEKLFFHDPSVRVPLIIVDPSPDADATRGSTDARLTEAIDLVPTIVDFMGGDVQSHILEGRSLLGLTRAQDVDWRQCIFSQADFSHTPIRAALDHPTTDCGMVMTYDGRWKYVHCTGLPPILFDLTTDPNELHDLGCDPRYADERARMQSHVTAWALGGRSRVTQSFAEIEAAKPASANGILIGFWDEADLKDATSKGTD